MNSSRYMTIDMFFFDLAIDYDLSYIINYLKICVSNNMGFLRLPFSKAFSCHTKWLNLMVSDI